MAVATRRSGWSSAARPGTPLQAAISKAREIPKEPAQRSRSDYDRIFPQHRLWETGGKKRFSPKEVYAIARGVGFNPEQALRMTEIAKGESGWFPGIWGIDANAQQTRGYGLWAMTPETWGKNSSAYKKFQALGGPSGMLNPVKNAQMAKFLYDESKARTGNGLKPWYGTRYLGTMKLGDLQSSLRLDGSAPRASSSSSSGGGSSSSEEEPAAAQQQVSGDNGVAALVAALTPKAKPVVQSAGVAAPSFAAGPVMPSGGKMVVSGGGGGSGVSGNPALQTALSALASQGAPLTATAPSEDKADPAAGPAPKKASRTPAVSRRTGRVVFAANADRPGTGTQPQVKEFLGGVAGLMGRPVQVGTGTRHDRLVDGTNRESDHWQGNAADLPAAGQQGDLIAAHAIRAATGMGFKKALQVARGGGYHNYNTKVGGRNVRVQVIWRAKDHYDHVHVGVAPR